MSGEWGVGLAEIELPDFELPRQLPVIPAATYERRIANLYTAMSKRGLDAVVVYADREHFANMSYLTGFDPRWEESLLILVPGHTPRLVVGNENVAWARVVPFEIDVVRLPKFSLIGQPDPGDVALSAVLRDAGLAESAVRRVGLIGWKFWTGPQTQLTCPSPANAGSLSA